MQLRVLSAEDVRASMDMAGAIEAMRAGFGQLETGSVVMPQRVEPRSVLVTPGKAPTVSAQNWPR